MQTARIVLFNSTRFIFSWTLVHTLSDTLYTVIEIGLTKNPKISQNYCSLFRFAIVRFLCSFDFSNFAFCISLVPIKKQQSSFSLSTSASFFHPFSFCFLSYFPSPTTVFLYSFILFTIFFFLLLFHSILSSLLLPIF